jgi:hypothetical protein
MAGAVRRRHPGSTPPPTGTGRAARRSRRSPPTRSSPPTPATTSPWATPAPPASAWTWRCA